MHRLAPARVVQLFHAIEISAPEVDPTHISVAVKRSIEEVGPVDVRAPEGGSFEMRTAEVGAAKMRTNKARPFEMRPRENVRSIFIGAPSAARFRTGWPCLRPPASGAAIRPVLVSRGSRASDRSRSRDEPPIPNGELATCGQRAPVPGADHRATLNRYDVGRIGDQRGVERMQHRGGPPDDNLQWWESDVQSGFDVIGQPRKSKDVTMPALGIK
jgi:hypothetical protein